MAFVLAWIPAVGFFGIFLAVLGIILGIIGLVAKGRPRNVALAGTIVSGIALLISIIMSVVYAAVLVTAVDEAVTDSTSAEIAPEDEPSSEAPAEETNTPQDWADSTFGTFDPISQTGTGDSVIALPDATAAVVTATHDGSSNFAISVLDATNQSTGDLLVNTIGAYSGTTAYGFNAIAQGVNLEVKADGNWSITIAPISSAPALAPSGAGDAVFLYDGEASTAAITHDGAANFVVSEETGDALSMGLLVNEIGPYSGTVPLSGGPSVIDIRADGNWTFTVG
ncbi:hypothetical protein ASF30_14840 [Leifsonia sp. Leaf264]|nr:hypothetical protein ASF30_14840 [Leifsonia sp. Leaf264]